MNMTIEDGQEAKKMNPVCLDCNFSRAIGCMACCKRKHSMVRLGQSTCELFKNGLARFRRRFPALSFFFFMLGSSATASIGSDIGGALDKVLTICLAIIALIVILVVLFFLYWLFGRGGQRG